MISEKLKDLIENLYSVFSKYEINSKIDGCPCCISDRDKEKIHDKKLKDLENEDLSRYAFKAMTTWGNVNDFKHFLPRLFELLVENKLVVGSSTILRKLEYGNWKDWESTEQESVRFFLFEWWNYSILNESYFNSDLFFGIYELTKDLDKLLNCWKINFISDNFIVFVRFIDDYYHDFVFKKNEFKNFNENDSNTLLVWIQLNSKSLEEGFYYYENINKQFATEISNALYKFD